MKKYFIILTILSVDVCYSQIPVELFMGNDKSTLDIMFFRYFKNSENKNSDWLFFNRNRVSINYKVTPSSNLPSFGFTEAISFNHPSLKGFAPVFVAQIFSTGLFPKSGFQYINISEQMIFFSWIVSELLKNPKFDFFVLLRLTPEINHSLNWFIQFETLSVFPSNQNNLYNFTQRARLGIKLSELQFGFAADFNQVGRKSFKTNSNFGGFLRYDF